MFLLLMFVYNTIPVFQKVEEARDHDVKEEDKGVLRFEEDVGRDEHNDMQWVHRCGRPICREDYPERTSKRTSLPTLTTLFGCNARVSNTNSRYRAPCDKLF